MIQIYIAADVQVARLGMGILRKDDFERKRDTNRKVQGVPFCRDELASQFSSLTRLTNQW